MEDYKICEICKQPIELFITQDEYFTPFLKNTLIGVEQRSGVYNNFVDGLPLRYDDIKIPSKISKRLQNLINIEYNIQLYIEPGFQITDKSEIKNIKIQYTIKDIEKYFNMILDGFDRYALYNKSAKSIYITLPITYIMCIKQIYNLFNVNSNTNPNTNPNTTNTNPNTNPNVINIVKLKRHHLERSSTYNITKSEEYLKQRYRSIIKFDNRLFYHLDQLGAKLLKTLRHIHRPFSTHIKGNLVKLDIKNAYESVNIDYLIQYLLDTIPIIYITIDNYDILIVELLIMIVLMLNGPSTEDNKGIKIGSYTMDILFEFYIYDLLKPVKPELLFVDDFVITVDKLNSVKEILKKEGFEINEDKIEYINKRKFKFCGNEFFNETT